MANLGTPAPRASSPHNLAVRRGDKTLENGIRATALPPSVDGSRVDNRSHAEKVLADKGCSMDELANVYEIPHTQQSKCKACNQEHERIVVCPLCNASQPPTKNDRKYHVRARVRREVIFQGDKLTYDTIRHASEGIEHGSGTFADIRNVDFRIYERTAKYLRQAIFDPIALEMPERTLLEAAPFDSLYLAPRPPEKQDSGKPIVPFDITTPKHD